MMIDMFSFKNSQKPVPFFISHFLSFKITAILLFLVGSFLNASNFVIKFLRKKYPKRMLQLWRSFRATCFIGLDTHKKEANIILSPQICASH
jgi:hypothetical protein